MAIATDTRVEFSDEENALVLAWAADKAAGEMEETKPEHSDRYTAEQREALTAMLAACQQVEEAFDRDTPWGGASRSISLQLSQSLRDANRVAQPQLPTSEAVAVLSAYEKATPYVVLIREVGDLGLESEAAATALTRLIDDRLDGIKLEIGELACELVKAQTQERRREIQEEIDERVAVADLAGGVREDAMEYRLRLAKGEAD